MDKKLIFLDIDGTILAPGRGISQGVKEGLKEARARGHQVFVCTGRSCRMLPEELEDVELDGVIANAGSDIWIHGENIYRTAFEESQLRYAFEVMDRLGAIYILEGYDRIYVSERGVDILSDSEPVPGDNPELARWKEFFSRWRDTGSMGEWTPELAPIPKISFMVLDRGAAECLYEELGEVFYVAFYPARTDNFFNGELISRTADKGTAIHRTAGYLKRDRKDTIAFGDSMNDYQMIREAGCGVVMGNGDERLKEIADRVCGTVDEDGVIRELARMGLI